jgi:hypothetical protein
MRVSHKSPRRPAQSTEILTLDRKTRNNALLLDFGQVVTFGLTFHIERHFSDGQQWRQRPAAKAVDEVEDRNEPRVPHARIENREKASFQRPGVQDIDSLVEVLDLDCGIQTGLP